MGEASADPLRGRIDLMVRNIEGLFNSMDPSPFHEKDLNADAEAFIVGYARQYPPGTALHLRIHLQQAPAQDATEMVTQAIRNFFDYRKEIIGMDFKQLMREGRLSLAIGLAFLFSCLFTQRYLLPQEERAFLFVLRESLTIGGWVGMWRPIQTYLYDWWPLRRRRRVFDELSRARIELVLP